MANLREYQAQHAMDTYIDSQIFPSWKEDEIMTGTRLYGSVTSIFITKYYFHNNKYIKMVSVSDAGNASNMLAWTINEQTKSLGKPTIVQGYLIKYCWDGKEGKYCYYKDTSMYFPGYECLCNDQDQDDEKESVTP